jgi:large repetitive protein
MHRGKRPPARRRLLSVALAVSLSATVALLPHPALAASVLYLHAAPSMDGTSPTATTATTWSMTTGASLTWPSHAPYAAQTILATDSITMNYWTTPSTGTSSPTVSLTEAYAATSACTSPTTIATTTGYVLLKGTNLTTTAFTPSGSVSVPNGSYLCWTIAVTASGTTTRSLNYDATTAATSITNSQTLTLESFSSATALASSASSTTTIQFAVLTATVTGSGPTPTGSVTFYDNGVAITSCTSLAMASGKARCSYAFSAAGTYPLTATYGGDGSYTGSSSSTVNQTVTAALSASRVGWGEDDDHELGDGGTTNQPHPVRATGEASGVVANATGTDHALLVTSAGAVLSTGLGTYGEQGNGGTGSNSTFTQVNGLTSGFVAVTTDYAGEIALRNDGTVWTWGDNSDGELGNGTTSCGADPCLGSSTPVEVWPGACSSCGTSLTGVIAIAAAGHTGMALRNDGTVWTWGYNLYGELGDGVTGNTTAPVQVVKGAESDGACTTYLCDITAIAGGAGGGLALNSAGAVLTWGHNNVGQLGNGTTGTAANSSPVQVSGLTSGITAVAAGAFADYALTSTGGVKSWGDNGDGELGENVASCGTDPCTGSSTPVNVSGVGGTGTLSGVSAIAGGYEHAAAIVSGGVDIWGDNVGYDELGNGTSGAGTNKIYPVQVQGVGGVGTLAGAQFVTSGEQAQSTGAIVGTVSTTTITSNNNPSSSGQSVTLTATVTPASPVATGTVTFTDGLTDGGSSISGCPGVALNGSAQATCTTSSLSVGTHSIVATYGGDVNYTNSVSSTFSQVVNSGSVTVTVTAASPSPTSPSAYGTSVSFYACLAPASGSTVPTGTVAFTDSLGGLPGTTSFSPVTATAPCTTGSGYGMATYTSNALSVSASHSITATYTASGSFSCSSCATSAQAYTINKATPTTTLTSSANPSTPGQTVTYTATVVAPGAGTPSGNVTFMDNGVNITAVPSCAPVALNGSAQATCGPTYTVTACASGCVVSAHPITFSYAGDSNFNTVSSSTLTQTVAAGSLSATAPADVSLTSLAPGSTSSGNPLGNLSFGDSLADNGTWSITVAATDLCLDSGCTKIIFFTNLAIGFGSSFTPGSNTTGGNPTAGAAGPTALSGGDGSHGAILSTALTAASGTAGQQGSWTQSGNTITVAVPANLASSGTLTATVQYTITG